MRIAIDMQSLQEMNPYQGMGLDSLEMTKEILLHRGRHEVFLILSGLFPDTVEPLRTMFFGLVPQENIRVWHAPRAILSQYGNPEAGKRTAEVIRKAFIASLRPDFCYVADSLMMQSIANLDVASTEYPSGLAAKQAINAMEGIHHQRMNCQPSESGRLRMALVSPMPPDQSGIADHTAELIPHLSKHYDLDVIVSDSFNLDQNFPEHGSYRAVSWFLQNANLYDRVLYQFGNSQFHTHMFDLLEKVPGVVVLHDLFLSNLIEGQELNRAGPHSFLSALYESHGYPALRDAFSRSKEYAVWNYPCSIDVAQKSLGVIVHSKRTLDMARAWYGELGKKFSVIPLLRNHESGPVRAQAKTMLGFLEEDFVVCSFGAVGPSKLNHRLLDAWHRSSLAQNPRCYLVFVGPHESGDYSNRLESQIAIEGLANVRFVGWVESQTYGTYLSAADIGVQLRTSSRGESSRAVLDCMSHGLATIVNSHGTMADLPPDAVWRLEDEFSDHELVEALEKLASDEQGNENLGAIGLRTVASFNDPSSIAMNHFVQIERFYDRSLGEITRLANTLASDPNFNPSDPEILELATAVSRSFPPQPRQRCLFIDISAIAQKDLKTGVERVVNNILAQFLERGPRDFRIEPLYASKDGDYRYARSFTQAFLGMPNLGLGNDLVDFVAGDVLLCLDLNHAVVKANRKTYQNLRIDGVTVLFVIYDLLPLSLAWAFPSGMGHAHQEWVEIAAENSGVICISRAVAREFAGWVEARGITLKKGFTIDHFPLGADGPKNHGLSPTTASRKFLPPRNKKFPTFLMVGTIEPRKGHEQVLSAFDELWRAGRQLNLLIVGKEGWLSEGLVARIRSHPEFGRKLVWRGFVSDEVLAASYEVSTCLLAASLGEGFGLPLVEAAQNKLPIMARDIPVFREIAGEKAFFFDGEGPESMALAVEKWLSLYERNEHPRTEDFAIVTWDQSAAHLASLIEKRVEKLPPGAQSTA